MVDNFPGPYSVRIFYTVSAREHVQELNLDLVDPADVGDAFDTLSVVTIGAQAPALDAYVDAWVALLQPFFHSGTSTIDRAELWEYAALTFDATFISAYDISVAGTSSSAVVVASEGIYTFRTLEGGIMKIALEDTVTAPGPSVAYAAMGSGSQDLVDFVLGAGGGWLGRDTSFPTAVIKFHPGVNERNFKKVYRS